MTLSQVGGQQQGTGVYLSCYDEAGDIIADFQNNTIGGWMVGVYTSESTEQSCSVALSSDCIGFDDSQSNVFEEYCSPPTCDGQELCP